MTTNFQPPPTYADPVVVDEATRKGQFNPIWLKWFLDLSQFINNNGGGGTIQHNTLGGLQGGISGEYYHLNQATYNILNNIGTPVAGSVAYGNGSTVQFTAVGSVGQVLTSAGSGAPTWTSLSGTAVTSFSADSTGLTPNTPTTGAVVLGGTLNIAHGGTGSATAAGAPFAIKGANSDITSLAGLTGPIQTPTFIQFAISPAVTPAQGMLWFDGNTTLNLQMTANVDGKINEDLFTYVKATAAITKGQLVMFDGTDGASGHIRAKPSTGVTVAQYIIGVAAESIGNGSFGLIQTNGQLLGIDTTGSSVGETWADGDVLYYNSAYAGGLTKVFPTSGPIVIAAAVIYAHGSPQGNIEIRPSFTQRVTGTAPVVSTQTSTGAAISLASGYGDTQNPYASKTANYVLAAPNGSAGVPSFRALVAADIPTLPYQPTAAPVTYTANFSVATTDVWVINNKSGSSCTATLPTASSYSGRVLRFQNYQAQTLVSASSNVVPIVGGAAGTAILNAVAGDTCTLVSDGTNWVMTQYTPNNVLLLE